jgi:ribonucleoside-diphosphate reductase alpha chain
MRPDEEIPEAFVTTTDLSPSDHVNVQAAFQKWVDSSISKTINVPEDIPFDQFKDVYTLAYEKGLKGCTTFRPSSEIMGILETEKKKKDEVKTDTVLLKMRPDDLTGRTYKIKTPLSPDAIYVTINDIRDEDGYRPYEIFINTKNLSQFSTLVAMTRLISAIFRREKNPKFLVEELKSIYDPNGGYFSQGQFIPSMIADIGRIIERHLTELGLTEKKEREKEVVTGKPNDNAVGLMVCPQCNHKSLVNQEHCLKCLECGYSKCG